MERRQTSTSADAMKALLQRRLESAQVNDLHTQVIASQTLH